VFDKRSARKGSRVDIGSWGTPAQAESAVQETWDKLRGICASPPIKPTTMNCSEESKMKGLQRRLHVYMSRREFKELYAHYDDAALARWVRCMERRRDDISIDHEGWLERMKCRRPILVGLIEHIKQVLQGFKRAQLAGTVINYIIKEDVKELNSDYSARQCSRVHQQVHIMCWFYDLLLKRYKDELIVVLQGLGDKTATNVGAQKAARTVLYQQYVLPVLAHSVVQMTDCAVSAHTVLEWYRVFRACDCQGFPRDGRGRYERAFFLDTIDMTNHFKQYMTMDKDLSVDRAVAWLDSAFRRKEHLRDRPDVQRYLPLSRSTVYYWMVDECNAKYDEHVKTYYTDRHEADDVVYDRIYRYIPFMLELERRMPNWVEVEVGTASEEALLYTASVLGDTVPCRIDHAQNKWWTKVHVDYLDAESFVRIRRQLLTSTGLPGMVLELPAPQTPCKFRHSKENCKCHLPLLHLGQDEAIYKENAMSKKVWKIDGKSYLRPKTEGSGFMASAVQGCVSGFGLPVTAAQLELVNSRRATVAKPPLEESPGVVFIEYGKMKDGYWNYERFAEQVDGIIDVVEVLYPHLQLAFEIDQSSSHLKKKEDGLDAMNMNLK
jgi:hypothetical protein